LGVWQSKGSLDDNWSDAGNWTAGVPSNAGDSATFGSGGVGNPINLDASKTVGRTRQDRRLLAYFEGLRQSAICCACPREALIKSEFVILPELQIPRMA
jgi:hypothetical protein